MRGLLPKLLLTILLCAAGLVHAQPEDTEKVDSARDAREESLPEPKMSAAGEQAQDAGKTLAASNDGAVQTITSSLPPGICTVVDGLVREFCNANPGDISCQFQQ